MHAHQAELQERYSTPILISYLSETSVLYVQSKLLALYMQYTSLSSLRFLCVCATRTHDEEDGGGSIIVVATTGYVIQYIQ